MNILITGGAGFVGSNLAVKLKEKYPAYTIQSLDNLKRRGSELNVERLKQHQVDFVHADIRNAEDLEGLPPFDILIDASAEPSVMAGISSPVRQVVNNNLLGTLNCLELAQKYEAGFIFLSTSRVYPIERLESSNFTEYDSRYQWADQQSLEGISSRGVRENFSLQGARSFYGATKLASELLIQEYQAFAGLKTIINRCGVISGPYQMGKVDQGFLVLWLARHYWRAKLGYFGYEGLGKQLRDVLHIQDLFELIDLQIHQMDSIQGQVFNVGGGLENSVSLQELTTICQEVTGNKITIDAVPEQRQADLRIYVSDHQKVTDSAGWRPKYSVTNVVEDVYDWIKTNDKKLESILK